MKELYWITRFDGIVICLAIMMVCSIIVTIAFMINASYDDNDTEQFKKKGTISGIICFICIMLFVLTPTTKEACIIYGIGGTIDYIKQDTTAQKLPQKVIIALDKYLESINKK